MWLVESAAEWFAEEYRDNTITLHYHHNAYTFTEELSEPAAQPALTES